MSALRVWSYADPGHGVGLCQSFEALCGVLIYGILTCGAYRFGPSMFSSSCRYNIGAVVDRGKIGGFCGEDRRSQDYLAKEPQELPSSYSSFQNHMQ